MSVTDIAPLALPANLRDWTVLDVGGWNGWATKEAIARGADPANCTVIDNKEYLQYGWGHGEPDPIEGVRFVECDLYAWEQPADLVLCGNVIYHLKDPFAGLAQLRTLTKRQMVLWTSFVGDVRGGGDWKWYPNGMGHPNGTVWARPTVPGLMRALKDAGFRITHEQQNGDHIVVTAVPI